MSRCCAGQDCDCYVDGYDDGQREYVHDFDYIGNAKSHSVFNFNEIKTYPICPETSGWFWIARIDINLPEGRGNTETEAIGDLLIKLSKQTSIVGLSYNK